MVYFSLSAIMALCGVVAARREPAYVPFSGDYADNKRFLKPEIVIIIGAFTFIFGCRWGVGIDYFHYYYAYRFGTDRDFELLFKFLSDGMSSLGLHYAVFFSLWAFIQITLLLWAFRNYRFLLPYILIYLIIGNYFMSMMNIIRHQIAALVFLCSIQYINDKKPFHYLISIFIAFLFHKSSVLMIVMYPILRFKDDWFKSIPLQLALLSLAVFLYYRYDLVLRYAETPFIWFANNLGYDNYQLGILTNETLNDNSRFGLNTGFGVFVNLFKCVPVIILSTRLKLFFNSRYYNMLYSMWFVRVFMDFATSSSIVLNRPFIFFTNIKIFIIASLTYYCFKKRNMSLHLLGIALIAVHLIMFLFILRNGEINTSMYTFFWQN